MGGILLIEDDQGFGRILERKLREKGYRVEVAGGYEEAKKFLESNSFDVVLVDIKLTDGSGLDLLKEYADKTTSKFIVITGYGDVKTAVDAMKAGAADFIQKPFSFDILEVSLERAIKEKRLEEENRTLKNILFDRDGEALLDTRNVKFREVLDLVEKSAGTDINVLLIGETGTGKEVLARYIHRISPRRGGPFIVVDCGTIPEHIFESELFGHEKGAYTGATSRKLGLVELADGGTLFLDEIGEVPLSVQAKLLRFVDTRRFRRVGGLKEISVDVRIIAATNRDLNEMVSGGKFRSDLLFRINTLEIRIPPLRERKEDIPLLTEFFLRRFRKKLRKGTLRQLESYHWPGNIRELKNTVERACLLARGEYADEFICLPRLEGRGSISEIFEELPSLKDLEAMYVNYLYERFGSASKVAQVLGCSRRTVFRKLRGSRNGQCDPEPRSPSGY